MTRPNRHRVQRQIIELAIGAGADGSAVHRELARPFWDRTNPEVESVFDRAAGPCELLQLDRVELDLGRIGGVAWGIEFRRKLIAELTHTLAQYTAVPDARRSDAPGDPPSSQLWRQFLFYLVHGYLPWWGTRPSGGWTEALLRDLDATGWSSLRSTAFGDATARVRLVSAVGDEFLDRMVAEWSGLRHAARALERLTPTRLRSDARQRWRRGFWMTLLDWISEGGFTSRRGGAQLLRDVLVLRDIHTSERQDASPLPPVPGDGSGRRGSSAAAPDDELPEPWDEWQSAQQEPARFERSPIAARPDAGALARRPTQEPPAKDGARTASRRPVEEDAIYLAGAGAILLHPFLEQLFRERGLLSGRDFGDGDARHRAVLLIGLLTFGSVDVPEYELVLAKLLCGMALEEPLEPVLLDEGDVAACDALLRAVLEHWTALRSSSPPWLREHFFLRDGKLETVDSGYRLTIERRAQDVLLARLPWGLGVIGFPWVAERIFVRWLD